MEELDEARHDAIRYLSAAVADDRMPIEQFESRLALVRQAPNRASLEAIIADVLPTGAWTRSNMPARVAPDHTAMEFDPLAPVEPADVLRIATVMGSSKRAGLWTVPLRLELKVVMGEMIIDLRDAVFLSDVLEIDCRATLAQLTLIVPAGVQVENECEERFSSSTHSVRSAKGANPLGLLIRITGRVLFSSIDIKEKRSSADEAMQPAWWQKLLPGV
jgi:hypothetical protein